MLLNEREIPFNARCATATLAKLLETGTVALTQKAKGYWAKKTNNIEITSVEGTQEETLETPKKAPETPEEQDDFLAWDKEEQTYTKEDLRAAVKAYADLKGLDVAKAYLTQHNYKRVSDVAEEDYGKVVEELKKFMKVMEG